VTATTVTTSNNNGQSTNSSTATCPAGKILLGGGATTTGPAAVGMSRPNNGTSTSAWEARAVNIDRGSPASTISVTAYAVCSA
jgi:hypothetical protein